MHIDLISGVKVENDHGVKVIRPLNNRERFGGDTDLKHPKSDGLRTEIKEVVLTLSGMFNQYTVSQEPKLPIGYLDITYK